MRHEPLTFVHAADLHLDSPFKGLAEESDRVASTLKEATFRAFSALIGLCVEVRADFLLIAGDVYDGCDRSLYAQLAFRDGLARLDHEGIASYVVHGNHDPLSGWASHLAWPARAHVLGADLATVPLEREGRVVARDRGRLAPLAGREAQPRAALSSPRAGRASLPRRAAALQRGRRHGSR